MFGPMWRFDKACITAIGVYEHYASGMIHCVGTWFRAWDFTERYIHLLSETNCLIESSRKTSKLSVISMYVSSQLLL